MQRKTIPTKRSIMTGIISPTPADAGEPALRSQDISATPVARRRALLG